MQKDIADNGLNLREVKKTTATEQVIQSIRDALSHQTIKYGDKLPNETELAAQLGVGRSSLREGIRALAAFGILEVRQGEGTFVVNRFADNVFDFLGFTPNTENFRYLMDLRRIFEIGCINMTVNMISEDDCNRMLELTDQLVEVNAAAHLAENIENDAQFHGIIQRSAGNPLITEMYKMISNLLCSMMHCLMRYDDVVADAKDAHRKIAEALKKRDCAAATEMMNLHLDTIELYLEKYVFSAHNH